jgi:hypothetical protein
MGGNAVNSVCFDRGYENVIMLVRGIASLPHIYW